MEIGVGLRGCRRIGGCIKGGVKLFGRREMGFEKRRLGRIDASRCVRFDFGDLCRRDGFGQRLDLDIGIGGGFYRHGDIGVSAEDLMTTPHVGRLDLAEFGKTLMLASAPLRADSLHVNKIRNV